MKLRIKSTHTTILILAIYHIIGALGGFYIISTLLLRTGAINGPLLFIHLLAISLYLLSLKAGISLLKKEYKLGLITSMIVQSLQIIFIAFGGYKFAFSSGVKLCAGLNFTDGFMFKFDLALSSAFSIMLNVDNKEFYLYVNFLAIFLLYILNDLYKEISNKKIVVEPEVEPTISPDMELPISKDPHT